MNNKDDIEILIDNLNSFYEENIPKEIQENSINKLAEIIEDDDLVRLAQPRGKGYWENSAKVLKKIGFPRLLIIADKMMNWLADLNWPGALIIYNIFLNLETETLQPIVERALIEADIEKDTVWIYWINELIEEKKIKDRFGKKYQIILDKKD